jgi:hypothetical protein
MALPLALLLLLPSLSGAQTLGLIDAARALQQSPSAKSPAFTCAADASGGFACSGLLPGNAYANKVSFFMNGQPSNDAEIILYLHGQGSCDGWLKNSNFSDLLRRSGRDDSILVIPCGQDPWAPGDSAAFARFWAGVVRQVGFMSGSDAPSSPRALVLAGHSHAGYGLARVLNFAKSGSYPSIREVYLFDCSFSDDAADRSYETFAAFGAALGNRLLSVIRVAPDNPKIMARMDALKAPYSKLDADAALAGRIALPALGTAFLTSTDEKVTHENIMNLAFPLLLARPGS